MPIDSGNLALKGLDDLFSTEENRQEEQREQVQQIPIDELYPFTNHPFKVLDDEAMTRTVESIAQYGVLAPLIARPRPEGGYEIISGHRRQYAAKLAGLETLPVIVRQMSDDAAVILMVDSNLQREHILPSERAFAYKMKLEALKNQGARSDLTSSQVGMKLQALDIVGQEAGDSRNQVHRFIRLTNLIPELLDMVDEKKISFNPAVELSYLDESQQRDFLEAMEDTQNAPSLSQAQQLKKMAQQGDFSYHTKRMEISPRGHLLCRHGAAHRLRAGWHPPCGGSAKRCRKPLCAYPYCGDSDFPHREKEIPAHTRSDSPQYSLREAVCGSVGTNLHDRQKPHTAFPGAAYAG